MKMERPRKLVLDTGALIEIDRNPRGQVSRACERAISGGSPPLLPAVVWAQAYRDGSRQVHLIRLCDACETIPFTMEAATEVGLLLARTRASDVVDAAVVLAAMKCRGIVVTSDPQGMRRLAESTGVQLRLVTV
jgi:hypothetical protein